MEKYEFITLSEGQKFKHLRSQLTEKKNYKYIRNLTKYLHNPNKKLDILEELLRIQCQDDNESVEAISLTAKLIVMIKDKIDLESDISIRTSKIKNNIENPE